MENKYLNNQIFLYAKTKEIEIPDNDPFRNDKLRRESDARKLTQVVNMYKDGAVITLDSAWGTGKTTFVMMWEKYLKKEKFPVVYYNAWEDDISDEPLTSMLGQMNGLNKEDGLDEVFRIGAKVVVGALVGGLIELNPAGRFLKGFFSGGARQIENQIYDSLKEGNSKSKMLKEFREVFKSYVEKVCGIEKLEEEKAMDFKPLVYIIDELDRCNPLFAVKVLERIKHLFEVPNVVFVLSVDKRQLAYSINGYYGSENIDSKDYLRRFIDIDYKLPKPDFTNFCDYLFDYFDFQSIVSQKDATSGFMAYARAVCDHNELSLRQIEKVFALVRLSYCSLNNPVEYDKIIFYMAYLKVCEIELYEKIEKYSLTTQELVNELEKLSSETVVLFKTIMFSPVYYAVMSNMITSYFNMKNARKSNEQYKDTIFGKDDKLLLTFKKYEFSPMYNYLKAGDYSRKLDSLIIELNILAHTIERGF